MAATETTGFSSVVYLNDGASNAYAVLAEAATADVPFGSADIQKYIKLNQSTRSYNKLVGASDDGQFSFTAFFTKADYQRLVAVRHKKFISGTTLTSWKVVTEDDGDTGGVMTAVFAGILDKVELDLDPTKISTYKVTVEVHSGITIT